MLFRLVVRSRLSPRRSSSTSSVSRLWENHISLGWVMLSDFILDTCLRVTSNRIEDGETSRATTMSHTKDIRNDRILSRPNVSKIPHQVYYILGYSTQHIWHGYCPDMPLVWVRFRKHFEDDAYNVSIGALLVETYKPVGRFGDFCSIIVSLSSVSRAASMQSVTHSAR